MPSKEGASSTAKPSKRKENLRKEFDTIEKEMEIAAYATRNGNFLKRTPREVIKVRTRKRRLLEKADRKDLAIPIAEEGPRIRGSRAALEEDVIQGSAVLRTKNQEVVEDEESSVEGDEQDELEDDEEMEGEEVVEPDDDVDVDMGEGLQDVEEEEEVIGAEVQNEAYPDTEKNDAVIEEEGTKPRKRKRPRMSKPNAKRRLMYRMRNFKSQRMAQRHGEALGAHAKGNPREAIEKLKQVAISAPSAPQVYSSLGMVYEDLLKTTKHEQNQDQKTQKKDESLREMMELAKKAYGSYHVAAVLCKKDFTLWVRAGDTAMEVAELCSKSMMVSRGNMDEIENHRAEKKRWIEEAKRDYMTADNLKPPGIDVPAKLAAAHMELGNLSESLTILTDLKNRPAPPPSESSAYRERNEFEGSHKAWLLYAELMLRIGHECSQWNKRIRVNKNYMFKRWLRKYSTIFDWQERRLQALALALEAATGSDACKGLMVWIKERSRTDQKKSPEAKMSKEEASRWHMDIYETTEAPQESGENREELKETSTEVGGDEEKTRENSSQDVSSGKETSKTEGKDEEKIIEDSVPQEESGDELAKILEKNKAEVDRFDEETKLLEHAPGSEESVKRDRERLHMLKRHKSSVVSFVGRQYLKEKHSGNVGGDTVTPQKPLIIAGSCSTVCSIASELMKHCLGLEQYEGGRVVAECVARYFQERARLRKRRIEQNKAFTERQKSTAETVLLHREAYDEIDDEEASADEAEDFVYFSDDDVIDGNETDLLVSLENGVLPAEIQVLYALCLIGDGGHYYLASKFLPATMNLERETINDMELRDVDTEAVSNPSWQIFHRAMTDPLRRIAAFAFVCDLVVKVDKEEEWACILAPLLQQVIEDLSEEGAIGIAVSVEGPQTPSSTLLRKRLLKVLLAAGKIRLLQCRAALELDTTSSEAATHLLDLTESVGSLLKRIWKVEKDASVPAPCIELLKILTQAVECLWKGLLRGMMFDETRLLVRLSEVVSTFLTTPLPNLFDQSSNSEDLDILGDQVPFTSAWQSHVNRELSLMVYNCAVSTNVALFSGWEKEEFTLSLMKRKGENRHFGISLNEGRVLGSVDADHEGILYGLWTLVNDQLPPEKRYDFEGKVKKEVIVHAKVPVLDAASVNGESEVLMLSLVLSGLALRAAKQADDSKKPTLLYTGLSILLPLSQLCLPEKLWDSSLGEAAAKLSRTSEWNDHRGVEIKEVEDDKEMFTAPEQSKAKREHLTKRMKPSTLLRFFDQWNGSQSSRDAIMRVVRLPAEALLIEWAKDDVKAGDSKTAEQAKQVMDRLHMAVMHLRECTTEASLQKASLHVCLGMLNIIEHAQNPFICMQHAAMFANQCSKGGNSDHPFKTELPPDRECTPVAALSILARADCLQAVHYPQQASFLCSYIARVCQLHRDKLEQDLEWSAQWKVVGICAFNISMAIRSTTFTTLKRDEAQKILDDWDMEVVGELERCRLDAVAVKRHYFMKGEVIEIHDDSESELDDDDEQEFEDGKNVTEDADLRMGISNEPMDAMVLFEGRATKDGIELAQTQPDGLEVTESDYFDPRIDTKEIVAV